MKWSKRFNHSGVQFIHAAFFGGRALKRSSNMEGWSDGAEELIVDQNNNSEMAFSHFPRLKYNYIKQFPFESYYKNINALHVLLQP